MAVQGPLANKIAIITGSGKENGIGAAIALTLARAGARVTINHVSDSSAARAVEADVSTAEGTKKIVEGTLSGFKVDHIDIIVNNAAIATYSPTLQTPPEDIFRVFGVVVVGPVLLLQAAYPHMPHGGRVINIGSVSSKMGFYQLPIYAAAKAAMDQLTWSLSREIGRDGKNITINTIAPGPVDTDSVPAGDPQSQAMKKWLISLTRAEDRVGTVSDIADAVLLLADEKSRWITGQYISASGGIV
ncbi:enoyl-(Acyl carrier protein) reductase domain-containing protein [Trichoderma breve]|uniref:Enoyl-(Acyl carrier protein) reductase domain-containing protein n=1 Tax=Trichoderma breve TaxID=2034170 RepID=A0A9W9BDN0_9HYPO|nr:enoyl-(Acyl carrier protein) reductase domain-containing protein [Trichoderma breve]KAJ4861353.1 enoyl-(Acyl carrier protein) reductase domain-containing protein [Trichoderma breve]